MYLFGKKKCAVGVDIGSSSVKMVELKETKKGYRLASYGIAPLPADVIVDTVIMDSAAVAETISGLFREKSVKNRDVAISMSGHSVIMKKITIPARTEEELEESIHLEAEQYIPFPISDVNLDFHIVEMTPGRPQMDVLVVAAKKEMINDYTAVVAEAGLRPVAVDVDLLALENMYCINYDVLPDETAALINLGASITNINILKGGTSVFTRDLSVAGRQITNEIQKQTGVSFENAEALKSGEEAGGVKLPDVEGIINSTSNALVSEIQRSLDFYLSTAPDGRIDKVYLSGGTSKVKGMAGAISERTGIPTEMADPFLKIDFDQKSIDPEGLKRASPLLCVGVGLAVRKPGD